MGDPRPFEDKHFDEILRNLPEGWPKMLRLIRWAESFGMHSESSPAEWAGQELELVPAAYVTPRPDAVTICVGDLEDRPEEGQQALRAGCEYDYLEFLYARDQNNKVIQIRPFTSNGILRHRFSTFTFVPPQGTSLITPIACFKIRGVWKGDPIVWDAEVPNKDMEWLADAGDVVIAALKSECDLPPRLVPSGRTTRTSSSFRSVPSSD